MDGADTAHSEHRQARDVEPHPPTPKVHRTQKKQNTRQLLPDAACRSDQWNKVTAISACWSMSIYVLITAVYSSLWQLWRMFTELFCDTGGETIATVKLVLDAEAADWQWYMFIKLPANCLYLRWETLFCYGVN